MDPLLTSKHYTTACHRWVAVKMLQNSAALSYAQRHIVVQTNLQADVIQCTQALIPYVLSSPEAWSSQSLVQHNSDSEYPALFWAAVTLLYHPEQTEPRTETVLFNLPCEQKGNILSRSASFYQNPLGFPQGNKLHLLIWHWQLSMCSNNVVSYYTLNLVTS